ncbi:MAG: oxidative damage protection protein [bacterium]
MSRKVQCVVLGEESEALAFQPYPGSLGERIFAEVSQQGWNKWLAHQTMLINEYRISPVDPQSREFLEKEMQKFLFEGGADKPEGFMPQL